MRGRKAWATATLVFAGALIAISSNVAGAAGKSRSTRHEFRKLEKPVNEADFNSKEASPKISSSSKKGTTNNTRRFDPYKNFKFK